MQLRSALLPNQPSRVALELGQRIATDYVRGATPVTPYYEYNTALCMTAGDDVAEVCVSTPKKSDRYQTLPEHFRTMISVWWSESL